MTGAVIVLTCSVQVLQVEYSYSNGSFTNNHSIAADNATCVGGAAYGTTNFERIVYSIDGIGLRDGNYKQAFELALSKEIAASDAFIYEAGPALDANYLHVTMGARLKMLPLAILLGVLSCYV